MAFNYFESDGIKADGLIVHELCRSPSHWDSSEPLDEWLESESIAGIYGIDTRRLEKKLRVNGVMLGLEVCEEDEKPDLKSFEEAKSVQDPNSKDLVNEVTIREPLFHGLEGKKSGRDRLRSKIRHLTKSC